MTARRPHRKRTGRRFLGAGRNIARLFRLSHATLRTRFLVGTVLVFLAFAGVLAGMVLVGFLPLYGVFQDVVEEVTSERIPLDRLRLRVLQTARSLDRYALYGGPDERETFLRHVRETEEAFRMASASPYARDEEHRSLATAKNEWEQGARLGVSLSDPSVRFTDPPARRKLEAFHEHFDRTMAALARVEETSRREIRELMARAEKDRRRGLFLFGALFVLGLVLAAAVGVVLARRVLFPLSRMIEGARQLSKGEYSHRVSWAVNDEFGRLARTFNRMAERLHRERARLRELSSRDPLTSLYNRRAFRERLREELERSRRFGHPCSLLVLDVDHFKRINDRLGHPIGDEALFALAAYLRGVTRSMDVAARYGGEEFVVLLPETTGDDALVVAERIRAGIAERAVPVTGGKKVDLTVSVGVATFPDDAQSEETLFAVADRALYAAKNAGRNRVRRSERKSVSP